MLDFLYDVWYNDERTEARLKGGIWLKPKLYFVADGWSHDCLAWYFRDPKQRIKAEVGEEIILRLTNMRPDGTCEGEVVNIDVKGVVEQRNDYVYGMFLHCRVSYDGEELMAMVAISNVPQRSDSVKFVPKERAAESSAAQF